jgi:hypothetical protein
VVIASSEQKRYEPFQYSSTDLNEFSRTMRAQASLRMVPGVDFILHDEKLPKALFNETGTGLIGGIGAHLGIADGKVLLRTEGAGLSLETLRRQTFAHPLRVHWLFVSYAIAADVEAMPERQFLEYVAKAVGGNLTVGATQYSIEINPVEVRRRAIATLDDISARAINDSDPAALERGLRQIVSESSVESMLREIAWDLSIESAGRELAKAALQNATNAQILEAFKSTTSQTRIQVRPGSPLAQAAFARVKAHDAMREARAQGSTGQRGQSVPIPVLERVDNRRPVHVILNGRFNAHVEVPVIDARGGPGGVVRV